MGDMCLRVDPSSRPTAAAVFQHAWLNPTQAESLTHADAGKVRCMLSTMRRFSRKPYIAAVYACTVARQRDHKSVKQLAEVFQKLDLDGNGEITTSEFRSGLWDVFGRWSRELKGVENL